jgi:hypothetical protein
MWRGGCNPGQPNNKIAEIRNQHGNSATNERFNNLTNYGLMMNKIMEHLQYDQTNGSDI